MKRALPLLLSLIVAVAWTTPAGAGGCALNWGNHCYGDADGYGNLTWACTRDSFTRLRMTCSFKPIRSHSDFIGLYVSLLGMTEASKVPDWWKFGSGDCREGALTLSTDASVVTGGPTPCDDPWGGRGVGTLGAWGVDEGSVFANTSATCTLTEPVAIEAEREYFACQFRVDAHRTVTNPCSGCAAPFIFATRYIELRFADGSSEILDEAWAEAWRCISYQSTYLNTRGCYSETGVPIRHSTWGQIKSLYR